MTRANRRGTRTQANQRYLCDRGRNRQGHGCEPGQGCRLSRRQGQVVRLLRRPDDEGDAGQGQRSEEHTSELQSLMRISYAVFCLKKQKSTMNIIDSEDKEKQANKQKV